MNLFFFLVAVLLSCSWWLKTLALDCKIVTEHGGNTKWTEHFIISSADISINATCRCSIGKPYWKKIDGTDLLEPDENTYCIDQGDMCDLETLTEKQPGRFVYRDLINFHANESTSLLCGNADQNYAPAITILISRKGKTNECFSSPATLLPSPSLFPPSASEPFSRNHISLEYAQTKSLFQTPSPSMEASSVTSYFESLSIPSQKSTTFPRPYTTMAERISTVLFTVTVTKSIVIASETDDPTTDSRIQDFQTACIGLGVFTGLLVVIIIVLTLILCTCVMVKRFGRITDKNAVYTSPCDKSYCS